MSQLALAIEAGVSPRHVSFVETGRASPSRDMILLLTETLDIPLRERNAVLAAAGYAAMYRETPLEAPEMEQVKRALGHILHAHGRCPAFVVNARYDILDANPSAMALIRRLVPDGPDLSSGPPNMLRLLLSEDCLRRHLENWEEVCAAIYRRVQREALGQADRSDLRALLRELVGAEPVRSRKQDLDPVKSPAILVPVKLKWNKETMSLFSTITTLGTPLDVTLQEVRVEALFPADRRSEEMLDELSGDG